MRLSAPAPKGASSIAVGALVGAAALFATSGAAQAPPAGQAWTDCELREDLPGGAELRYQSVLGPGSRAAEPHVAWSTGLSAQIHMNVLYARGPTNPPTMGSAFYFLRSEPGSADYRLVFDFDGGGPPATLSLGPGAGRSLRGDFRPPDAARMAGFASARRVTASIYEGDRRIDQATFELAPDRRAAGLQAFARRVQANDGSICRAASGPPMPVPPVEHRLDRPAG